MGPAILARALAGARPLRGEGPRQRAGVHRQARSPSASCPPRARGSSRRARSSSARGTRPSRCGRRWTTATLPARTRLGPARRRRRARSGRARARRRRRSCARSRARLARAGAADAGRPPRRRRLRPRRTRARGAARSARLDARGDDRLVAFVGKLIVSKGVDLLPPPGRSCSRASRDARLVVVGFGAYRDGLERLLAALAAGDLDAARDARAEGRAAEGGPRAPLRHLLRVPRRARGRGDREAYLRGGARGSATASCSPAASSTTSSPTLLPRLRGAGRAEHVPGGVRHGRRRGGGLRRAAGLRRPLGARRGHARRWRRAVPRGRARWLSFGARAAARSRDLADRLIALAARRRDDVRERDARRRSSAIARERCSWEGVARGVIAAAGG